MPRDDIEAGILPEPVPHVRQQEGCPCTSNLLWFGIILCLDFIRSPYGCYHRGFLPGNIPARKTIYKK